jgi:trehalose transport system substrate-binding protein
VPAAALCASPAPPAGPTVTLTTRLADAEWRVIREEVLPPFKRACHCRVRAIHVSPELLPQRLKAMRAAGQIEIHLFAQDNMRLQELIDAGLVQLLDVADLPLDSAILPSLAAAGVFDGHRHFLPLPPNAQIACYNTATCAPAELTQSRNWDAALQVARTLRAKDGIARVPFKAV